MATAVKEMSRPREKESVPKSCSILGPSIHASKSRSCRGLASSLPLGKDPAGTRGVTGVAVRIALQIVLVLRLRFPEIADRRHLCDDLARPQARRVHVGDRLLRHLFLLVARIEDRRTVRSEEQTSELQSLMRNSYAVFCLKKKNIIDRDEFTKLIYNRDET